MADLMRMARRRCDCKSNIMDAVRWVLGELRGESMQDVISNGNTSPRRYAGHLSDRCVIVYELWKWTAII